MPSELTIVSEVILTLVVKKVKGKLYVYDQFRVSGKVITKYVGPLEEIVRLYQIAKIKGQVNYKLSRKELKIIAKELTKSVVNLLRNLSKENLEVWRRGRDLNPRGGTPHRLSRPAPYQARRPRLLHNFLLLWGYKC